MQFKILSHAGLSVTGSGVTLVCDPWVVGSCYWRAWWNYPPVSESLVDQLKPDFIYLTHIHWDHFHGPSLRRFPRTTPILVPKGHYGKIKRDLYANGFKNVVELRHGQRYDLAPGFRLTSYQFFPYLDSALVMECEGLTLFNANDAKFVGAPLRQILKRHPKIDFVFRSHSSANGRMCYEVVDDPKAVVDDESAYIASFASFVRRTNARYAIPFASNHCFLHKEVYPLNNTIKTPRMVEAFFKANQISRPELKVMVTGDSWSSESGFQVSSEGGHYFEDREKYLDEYRRQKAGVLDKFYGIEERAKVTLEEVQRYFRRFCRALPFPFRWYYRGYPITVELSAGDSKTYFEVDLFKGRARQIEKKDEGREPLEMHTSAFIFKQAMALNLFAMVPISKRVRYRVTRRNKSRMTLLNQLFCLYEYELLPLRRCLRWRFFETWMLRWREALLYLRIGLDVWVFKNSVDERKYIETW